MFQSCYKEEELPDVLERVTDFLAVFLSPPVDKTQGSQRSTTDELQSYRDRFVLPAQFFRDGLVRNPLLQFV